MLKFKEALKTLKDSEVYNKKSGFLCNGFIILENGEGVWQIDFYDNKEDKIISFTIGDQINFREDKAFKNEEIKISKLELDKIKINLDEALEKVDSLIKDKYSKENVGKAIIILQNYKGKNIWNVTYITSSLKTLNVKLSAETGRIIEDSLKGLIQKA